MKIRAADQAGLTLAELLIAVVLLSLGVLALGRLFPSALRPQQQAGWSSTAAFHSQERLQELTALSWNDSALSIGRHPGGTASENLGTAGTWRCFYTVAALAPPLDDCKRVTVTVTWRDHGEHSTSTSTYLRR